MTDNETKFKRFLTREQAAKYMGVSVSWLEKNTKQGPPYIFKVGRVIYDRDKIDEWMVTEG